MTLLQKSDLIAGHEVGGEGRGAANGTQISMISNLEKIKSTEKITVPFLSKTRIKRNINQSAKTCKLAVSEFMTMV